MLKRIVKRIFTTLSWLVIAAVALPIVAGLLLQVGVVQNFVAGKVTDWLSLRAGTTISVDRVSIGFFNRAVLEGIYVQDPFAPTDTLLYAGKLSVGIEGINFFNGNIALGAVSLSDGDLHVARDSAGRTNLDQIIAAFRPKVPRQVKLRLSARELNLIGMDVTMRGGDTARVKLRGLDLANLELRKLNFQARGIVVRDDSVRCRIEHLNFTERCGFRLQHLAVGRAAVGRTGVRLGDMRVETPLSLLQFERLDLLTGDTLRGLRVDVVGLPSSVSYRTIALLTGRNVGAANGLAVGFDSLALRGPVGDLKGRLAGTSFGRTRLDAEFEATGLPDVEMAWFRVRLRGLETDGADIRTLYGDATGGRKLGEGLTGMLDRAGRIGFTGTFDGHLRDFTAEGRLTTEQGAVAGSLKFMPGARRGEVRMVGKVETQEFGAGSLLASKDLGRVSLRAGVDAVSGGDGISLRADAVIGRLDFKNYTYNGIGMNGRFEGRTFTGRITSQDPNLEFVTSGRFDLGGEVPAYDFEMDLRRADLTALGLNRRDSVSRLAMRFRAHATGTTVDDINGEATIDSLSYVNHMDTVRTGTIRFEAVNAPGSKRLAMRSDFADLDFRGSNSYGQIARFFRGSLGRYLPSLSAPAALPRGVEQEAPFDEGYYLLKVDVKEANNVAAIFVPGLEIAQGSSLGFLFNPGRDEFSLSVRSDYIFRRNLYVGNLSVECRNQADSVSVYASAEQFGVGTLDLPNLSVVGGIGNNRIALATRFSNPENGSGALVSTSTTIGRSPGGLPQLDVEFFPTTFTVKDQLWYIAPSHVALDSTGIDIRGFRLWGEGQQLAVDGRASASEGDTLRVGLRNFDMSPLTQLVERQGYRVGGRMGGEATLVAPLGALQFEADFRMDSLMMNDYLLGRVDFHSDWDGARRWVKFEVSTPQGEKPVTGVYDSGRKRYRADFDLPRFDMVLLEPLLQGILVDTRGRARTKLVMTGGPEGGPVLDGTIDVERYEATVGYTRARYTLAGPVSVRRNRFELPGVPISDGNGGTGTISAWFDSEFFRRLKFGVRVDFRDLLCMNTTLADNPDFYGKLYGTGTFSVSGDDFKTLLDVRAETARSSTFVLPLSEVSTIAEADFISFARPQGQQRPADRVGEFRKRLHRMRRLRPKSELNVNLNLTALPNTEAQIVMDPRLGDAIKGRGNGRFRMNIVPARDVFTLDGQYDISEGTYLFTLYGVLANKYFVIQPGSSILWTGDPGDPLVNIEAAYRVRTSLKPLLGGTQGTGNGNVNVSCGIRLTEQLFNPTIQLSISAPGADPETKNLLRNLLNTEEATTMQFAYLMLSNSFMPDDQANAIGTMSGSLAGIAGMEFLSNQISNLISGSNYNVRFGYRPSSELTSEEVTFDVGADIIANKLSVEVGGNYDVGQRGAYQISNNPLSVDGYVTWVLNKSGSLKVKGFTRTIDRFDESQGLQDNGVGVYYRQEFQSWRDLKERYRRWREAARLRRADRREKRGERRQIRGAVAAEGRIGLSVPGSVPGVRGGDGLVVFGAGEE